MKICQHDPGHMTKMAATPIYGKNPSKSSPEAAGRFSRNLVCSIIVYINDDPGVTLTYITAWSNLITWENSGFFRNYCCQ